MSASSPVIVILVPVPVVVVPPGDLISVQVPAAGNPFITTPPVATSQVGCVIVPTTGEGGDDGLVVISTLLELDEAHPAELLTVNV